MESVNGGKRGNCIGTRAVAWPNVLTRINNGKPLSYFPGGEDFEKAKKGKKGRAFGENWGKRSRGRERGFGEQGGRRAIHQMKGIFGQQRDGKWEYQESKKVGGWGEKVTR